MISIVLAKQCQVHVKTYEEPLSKKTIQALEYDKYQNDHKQEQHSHVYIYHAIHNNN